jgi:hypothetical protein
MVSIVGWFFVILLTGVIGFIGWWQWNSYVTLDQRIDQLDSTLLESAGTRVEKVLDAPPGSQVVAYVASSLVPIQNTIQVPVQTAPLATQNESAVRLVQD